MSSQRIGKYACLEIERRYLLRELPTDLIGRDHSWYIVDRYISNTRLRLRRMISPSRNKSILKLGQKYRDLSQDHTQATMTTMYLNDDEYQCLEKLEAKEIAKKHFEYEYQERVYGIDVFEGSLQGLILAETECETAEELAQLSLPSFAFKDVTDDPFFSGGFLASINEKKFREGLVKRLSN
jgi:CYTH domain-containing protein